MPSRVLCAGRCLQTISRILELPSQIKIQGPPVISNDRRHVANALSGLPSKLVASLIGRSRSSAFRLSTSTVSMSPAGSCFSSESAPGPFHHGSRERGGTIYWAALPSDERRVQATKRTHLIHRPARDIIPPLGGARMFSYSLLACDPVGSHAVATSRVQRNSVPSTHMRCMITANRRASATIAFFIPRRLAICIAQALSHDHLLVRVSMTWAAS